MAKTITSLHCSTLKRKKKIELYPMLNGLDPLKQMDPRSSCSFISMVYSK